MGVVIGVDVGTSGTKAVAVNEAGQIVGSSLAEYPLLSPKPSWAEQDPSEWTRATLEVLRQLANTPGFEAADVKGIGLTGQMHGSVFLDAENHVLRNAILWCDQRTANQCAAITEKVGEARLIEMVCNPALTGFTAPKILWLRENEPRLYDRVVRVLLPKDYVRLALTGEFATDVADASGTLLFDVKKRTWHTELLSILDIPTDFMPKAFEGPDVTGTLTAQAAQKTGLPKGIPVVAGGGDQAAGGVGCGIVRKGAISSTVGTSGVVFAFADEVRIDPEGRVHTFCHSVPGTWHVMGVMLSAGGSLRWFRDALCQNECAVATQTGVDPYAYITAEADAAPLGAEGLLFLPYLTGERTPHKDPYAKGAFIGLSLRHTRAHMARAVLEGVAYGMRDSLEIVRAMGVPIAEVRASGGGARSTVWRQIQADVNRAPLVTLNIDQGPAYGAALLAMVGTGMHASVEQACDATIRVIETCTPNPARSAAYDAWFAEYQELYRALAPRFRQSAVLLEG
ncbi:MAG TPA: xylulokinase [Candidatus Hydrogenedentes bacterium]|nr:xylulokinase [Candidatus Hydrogenedentota bacterium]